MIQYFNKNKLKLHIATRTTSKADWIIESCENKELITLTALDCESDGFEETLRPLVKGAAVVISMLPWLLHPKAAKVALEEGKHFCTTSYVSDYMNGLDEEAKSKNLIFLNECGVDPGLDHMSAQKIIDEVHAAGGKIVSFHSICGALPAPDANDNPFGYKFSWAPRGVLLASRSEAQYLKDGAKVEIGVEQGGIFDPKHVTQETFDGVGDLEWYLNRDSVKYIDIYKIPEVQTIVRGTYRFPGWCTTIKAIADLGLTDTDKKEGLEGKTYNAWMAEMFGTGGSDNSAKGAVAAKLGLAEDSDVIKNLDWVGLFDAEKVITADTWIDALCVIFKEKLVYQDGEKDMLAMKHTFQVENADGSKATIMSQMVDFGLDGCRTNIGDNSSIARTVGLPLACAVRAILDGRLKGLAGVLRPTTPELYNLILEEMETLGVTFKETRT